MGQALFYCAKIHQKCRIILTKGINCMKNAVGSFFILVDSQYSYWVVLLDTICMSGDKKTGIGQELGDSRCSPL